MNPAEYYVGLMSGTSLDGIDAALVDFSQSPLRLLENFYLPYSDDLLGRLLALHEPGHDELHKAAAIGNELARLCAEAVASLLERARVDPADVVAIGCHGQTVHHRPDLGYSIQLGNPALLAELTGIAVVADFRGRDIAAGGQGAPLVPAVHAALFRHPEIHQVVINIGGICNLTSLPPHGEILGFDCGPGNLLMDAWCKRHTGRPFDKDGAWAASGQVLRPLLKALLSHPFFAASPPKSTGRDVFNLKWVEGFLSGNEPPADVQATLLELTVECIAKAVSAYCSAAREIYVCGGGARNRFLVDRLRNALKDKRVELTDALGVDADWLEAFAFAWLARQTINGEPGNLPEVTGAKGKRILGAIYKA